MSAKGRTLKVGVFVFFGLVLSTIAIFVIGDSRRVWDRKVQYHAAYDDVVGLRTGSVVRMGGIDIGMVSEVQHGREAADHKVYVTLDVAREEAGRVRNATVATIEGKGLLGDKMVVLLVDEKVFADVRKDGKDPLGVLPAGGWLRTQPPADPVGDAQKAAQAAKIALENVQKVTESLATDQFKEDVQGTVHSLREILDGVALRDGVVHRLIFDPEEARRVDRILANLDATTGNLARMTADVQAVTSQVRTGPGFAHSIVYDEQLAQNMNGTVAELNKSLAAVRTGNGLAHTIVYGDDQSQKIMGNMNAMSEDLREIVANLKAGRGTMGALLVDPTVYEDIKSLVGNVERNQVLRSLVRYSIKQNEKEGGAPHAEVKGDAPQPTVPASKKASGGD